MGVLRIAATAVAAAGALFAGAACFPDDPPAAPPKTPAAPAERAEERAAMVERQIASSPDGREPVRDGRVLGAMRAVPRHRFVPEDLRAYAYDDGPLPIGHGQTISQPYIVALMTELLGPPAPGAKVLEIGTGSGYQAAVLAELGARVFTIEIVEALARSAERALRAAGYGAVRVRCADGYYGWPEEAPFDGIIVTCAAGHLPPPLWEQLAPGGRIVIPIGGPYEVQRLVVIEKDREGRRASRSVTAVRFVPMVGAATAAPPPPPREPRGE